MNLFQNDKHDILQDLNIQLADFGLRPSEWKLLNAGTDQIKIQNKLEDSFYFFGSVQHATGKSKWKDICLISL